MSKKGDILEEIREFRFGFDWNKILKKNWPQIFLVGIGVILVGFGLFYIGDMGGEKSEVEIITEEEEGERIVVDVGGAVERPGVYELKRGARIDDVLIAAGGISVEADREFLARFINRAQKVEDGAKIYVLKKNDKGTLPQDIQQVAGVTTDSVISEVINVNTASAAELDRLWGIGPATAQKIIEGRPYLKVEELLTKKILKKNVYEENKDKLGVF